MHVPALPGQTVSAGDQLHHVSRMGDLRVLVSFNDPAGCGTIPTEGPPRCQPQLWQHDTRDFTRITRRAWPMPQAPESK
jgi:hypothetical protein